MELKLFKTRELEKMLLENDIALFRITPPLITPHRVLSSTYMLIQGEGIGTAISKHSINGFNNTPKDTILSGVPLQDIIDYVARSNLNGSDKVLESWKESKAFVDTIDNTYEEVISTLYVNDNCLCESDTIDYMFDECINSFYYLLKAFFRSEIPDFGEDYIEKKLSEMSDYFFGNLLLKCQSGVPVSETENLHHVMLLHYFELSELASLYLG